MADGMSTVAAAGAVTIQLLNEPGILIETAPGAGVNFVASVHAPGQTTILEQVFSGGSALGGWIHIALDPNGNATIPVHFTATGQYLNILSADSSTSVQSFGVTIGDTMPATTPGEVITVAGGATEIFASVPIGVLQTAGASTVISSAGALTINASGGSQLIFDSVGNSLITEAPVSEFVGNPTGATSTINAASGGSDTILAGTGVLYNGTNGTNSLFVGGTGAATVVSATNETAFGGAGGGNYAAGTGSFFFFGGGGTDNISGIAGAAAATVWGNTNENVTVADATGKATLIAFGANDIVNAAASGGGNTFLVVNQALPTADGNFAGTSTLVGSAAGNDVFVLQSNGGAPTPAHTITIEGWQTSDLALLSGYSAVDVATADNALAAAAPGAGASFTLSDNTTVTFVGAHPGGVIS